jgi:hypothetical protein
MFSNVFSSNKASRFGKFTDKVRNLFGGSAPIAPVAPKLAVKVRTPQYPVVPFKGKHPRLPLAARLYRCPAGYFFKEYNHTPLSGPCPNPQAAHRTAMRNFGIVA